MRNEAGKVSARRLTGNPRGKEMRLVMVNADEGHQQRESGGLGGAQANKQRRRQAGTARGGYGLEFGGAHAGLLERGAGDGQEIAEVFTGGEFGHYAAVFGVEADLGGDDVGQEGAVAHHGSTGFVTGCLEGQQQHPGGGRSDAGRNYFAAILPEATRFAGAGARSV